MVRMYRAGTAFVDVIPSFKNIQKDIAKKLRNDLKEAFADKDAYSELDKNIERSFASAMDKASDEVRDHLREVNREIQRETEKGATASAKAVKKAVDKELGGGWYGEHTRKIGDQLKKHLGPDFLKGIKSEYQDTRKSIIRDVDSLTNAFTANGINDAREIERVYTRLKRALDKVGSLQDVGVGKGKLANARAGADLLASNFDKIVGGKTEAEIKEQNRINRLEEKEQLRHEKQLNANQAAADRETARLTAARQKAQALADAREEARQRRRYDDLSATQSRDYTEIGSDDKKGNARQQRIAERRAKIIEDYQRKVNSLMRDLESLGAVRPKVTLDTAEAVGKIQKVQSHLRVFMSEDYDKDLDINVDPGRVMNEMRILREGAKKALADIDLEVDIDDREMRANLARLRGELAEVSEWDVDARVGVDLDETDYYEAKARIDAIGQSVKDIKLQIDDRDARSDINAIRLAVDAIKGKTVGIDITEREAVAQIETIKAALASVRDKNVEIDIDYDDDALKRFAIDAAAADAQSKRLARSIANAGTSMSESTQAFRVFNPMLAAVAFLGAPAVSAIGGLTAGVGALVSILPGAAAGLGTLGFAFGGLEDAVKKYDKAQEALAVPKKDLTEAQKDAIAKWEAEKDALGEATVAWIEYTRELKTGITEIQKGAREGLFPGLQSSIETIMGRYADPFTDFLRVTGKQLGDIAEIWANKLTGDEAAEWFARVGEDAAFYLPRILQWTENVVTGFANLTDAFRPFAREFTNWLVDSSAQFENWAGGLADNPKFERFLDSIRSTMPLLADFAKEVGELFVNLTIAVEPFSVAILDAMTGALEFLNAMDPTVLGAILGAVGGLTGGLMLLSGVVAGVGALATVMGAALSTPFTAAITGVATFSAVSATALGVTTAMSGASGTLGEVMGTLGGALQGAADHGKEFWGAVLNLLDAFSPLAPVLAEIVAHVLNFAVAVSDTVLVGGLNLLADLLGLLVKGFSLLPEVMQEAGLLALAAALSFGKLSGALSTGLTVISPFLKGLGAFADMIPGLISGVGTFVSNPLAGMSAGFDKAKTSAKGALAEMNNFDKAALIIGGVTLALGALAHASSKINEGAQPVVSGVDAITASIQGMGVSAESATASLDKMFAPRDGESLGSKFILGVPEINDAKSAMEEYNYTLKMGGSFWGDLGNEARTVFGLFGDTPFDAVNKQLSDMDESLVSLAGTDFQAAADGFATVSQSMIDAGMSQEDVTKKFSGYRQELENTAASLGLANDKSINYYEWMKGNVPPSVEAAVEAQGRQEEGLAGVASKTDQAEQATRDLIAATDELAGRYLSQEEANTAYYEAMDKFNEYVKTAKGGIDEQTKAGRENRKAIAEMASATKRKADADLEATGDVDQYTNTLWKQREALIEAAKKMGATEEEAGELANTVLEIPEDVTTKARLKDWASDKAKGIQKELAKIKQKINIDVTLKYYEDKSKLSDLQKKYPGARIPAPPTKQGHDGFILEPFAQGGLKPMDPIAQMVKPNTWRVVGDRMKDDEAYIPLDGSPRSWSILLEALRLMPGTIPFHDGAIAQFAAGAVASAGGATPAPAAPAAPGQEDPNAATDMSAVSAAFEALSATLSASWGTLLADLLGQATTFYANLLTLTVTNHGLLIAADQSFRSTQTSATSSFFSTLYSTTANGGSNIQSSWSDTLSAMATRASGFRGDQANYFDQFLNGTLLGTFSRFGNSVNNGWADTWRDLVSSAKTIFSVLPSEVGSILSATSGKMNKHIVDPYNKIVKDLDLKKSLKIPSFPVQKYADGGIMRGYTPGRDVHTFVSPTGGVLELSGGEPVLRPEAGLALGTDWVDGINAAARNAGVEGVRRFLGGQAFASGGFIQSFASGGTLMDAADWWIGKGAKASRHSRFNGGKRIKSGHSSNSLHYQDRAVDLNFAAGTSSFEQGKFNQFLPAFKKEFPKIRVIWLTTGHYDHMHIDTGNGADIGNFSGASGGGGYGSSLYDIGGAMSGFIAKAQKEMGAGAIPELMGGIGAKVFTDLAKVKASEFIDPTTYPGDGVIPGAGPSGNFIPGKGVKRWAGVVREALERVRQPVTDPYVNMTLRRMNQESGGNPRAINNWDINAKRGTPSKGLMQVIDPTFRAFRDPGLPNNIWEPISNIVASMRYALKRYKSLPAAYNRKGGYADGGMIDLNPDVLFRDGGGPVPKGYSMVLNDLNHEETILPKTTHEVTKAFERIEDGEVGGPSYNIYDNVFGDTAENAITEMHRQSRIAKIGAPVKL